MLIDTPKVSRELYNCCNIHSTDGGSERLLFDIKEEIDSYSEKVTAAYKDIWETEKSMFKRDV